MTVYEVWCKALIQQLGSPQRRGESPEAYLVGFQQRNENFFDADSILELHFLKFVEVLSPFSFSDFSSLRHKSYIKFNIAYMINYKLENKKVN